MRTRRWLPQLVWLTVVWVMLWGTVGAMTLLGGLLVAALVTVAFPLPPARERLRVRPLRLLALASYLAADLMVSSAQVTWTTIRHGRRATAGIVAVPLLTTSSRVTAVIANAVTLAPGTFVMQLDHHREICYVYNLGLRTAADADRVRRQVLALQRRVLGVFGMATEIDTGGPR